MKILRIWGIPIHRILSDTEFVEKIRRGLRHSEKYVWVHVFVLLVVCVIVPIFIYLVWQLIQNSPDQSRRWIYAGLFSGILVGVLLGQYLFMGVQAILAALNGCDYSRSTKLLVKYHDMLQQMDALEEDDEQNRQDGTGGK